MHRALWNSLAVPLRFRGFKPQAVTPLSFFRWLFQFSDRRERRLAISALKSVIYLSEKTVRETLVDQNDQLLRRLSAEGVPAKNVIYVQVDDAGSSSPVMLNLLRNHGGLEKRGCSLMDSRHVLCLRELTEQLAEGALVYVDDFVGTADQFTTNTRPLLGEHIIGNFAEFFLAPVICEEGVANLGKLGVETVTRFVHTRAERPLYGFSSVFAEPDRHTLMEMTKRFANGCFYDGLGYKRAATMYVLYSNSPDTVPRVFRGSTDQKPFRGIFPRFNDLPLRQNAHATQPT